MYSIAGMLAAGKFGEWSVLLQTSTYKYPFTKLFRQLLLIWEFAKHSRHTVVCGGIVNFVVVK